MNKIWTCKIGECVGDNLPHGADHPMREAVEKAYREITGRDPAFQFSGWGGELTEPERAVVENRLPRTITSQALTNAFAHAINCESRENASNTPDFILASYLVECLKNYEAAVNAREKWYGREVSAPAAPITLSD